VKVRFLGTAAGGGIPQWNCACVECARARRDGTTRTQDCLAISGDGQAWYLVNASPDLRTQLLRTAELAPGPGPRDTPLRGVLLTTAELDHTAGLLALREADRLAVYATAPVAKTVQVLDAYTTVDRRTVLCGEPFELDGGLTATAFALGSKRPRYAVDQPDAPDWVVGYRFAEGASGRAVVYASCFAEWSAELARADVVILDGTFFSPDEMDGLSRSASGMGHLPIRDSLPLLRANPGPRYLYTHLNNTNPVAHPAAPQRALLVTAGAGVAPEGGLLELPAEGSEPA
jgi:pyrroloquinoline quinone biosynthesis protein B